jgi:hypothetical protein
MAMYFLKKDPGSRLISGKFVVLLMMLFSGINNAMSQQDTSLWKSQLQQATSIEGRCLGYTCHESALFANFDSLTRYFTAQDFEQLMSDSNYVVKYYAFYGMLLQDDSLAFRIVQRYISDTTSVTGFANCTSFDIRFNEEIIHLYQKTLSMKYQFGGMWTYEGFHLNYPTRNLNLYRNKMKELNKLVATRGFKKIPLKKNYQY